jgi:hypothetical protein
VAEQWGDFLAGLVGDVELLVRAAPPMRLDIRFTWTSGPAASG